MRDKLIVICFIFAMCAGTAMAATHFFTDGLIPDGMEFSIGYADIDEDNSWIDVYVIPFRLEASFGDKMSLFGEFQYADYDFESTFNIGGGAMVQLVTDGETEIPLNVSVRGSLFYGFEKETNGYTSIPSIISLEGRGIVSKRFSDHPVDWTPYGCVILQYSKWDSDYDDDSETYFDIALGAKLRFDNLALFAELIFGDLDGIGIGGSYSF
ncbi:hypothetical protein JW823_10045 [bacterium]|nr:hypothetical protein [candidate division CSSED10-310 bacterium]